MSLIEKTAKSITLSLVALSLLGTGCSNVESNRSNPLVVDMPGSGRHTIYTEKEIREQKKDIENSYFLINQFSPLYTR